MPATIYALLIGINDYQVKPLRGCLNDVQAIEKYLQWFQSDPKRLFIKKVRNQEATREGIINAFDHFTNAKNGDFCFLYFSGHGSYAPAPKGFYNSTDRFHQTLVCWDSRQEGGRDLMDKELAFLIWKYSVGLDKESINFLVITDSCHSGTVTRKITSGNLIERTLDPVSFPIQAADYYGFGEIINGKRCYAHESDSGEKAITVQTGPHIHIASARDQQTAKEDNIDGKPRGLFTYSLLKALYSSNGLINYSELVRRAEINIKGLVTDQVPVLNIHALPASHALNIFLRGEGKGGRPTNWVYFNAQRGWCIDAGALHGITKGDRIITENKVSSVVTEVFGEEASILSKPAFNNVNSRFPATILPRVLLRFGFDISVDQAEMDLIINEFIKNASAAFTLASEGDFDYRICASPNGVFVASLSDDKPLFKEFVIGNDNDASLFLDNINRFSVWNQLLKLQNPASTISSDDYLLNVTASAVFNNYDANSFEKVADLSKPIPLSYFNDNTTVYQPAIQVEVKNTSVRELWFYTVIFSFDFSINNNSFKSFSLLGGDKAYLTLNTSRGPTTIIKLLVEKKHRDLGYFEITDHLKIIISTTELSQGVLAKYQQAGLELTRANFRDAYRGITNRGFGEDEGNYPEDWTTTILTLKIIYPSPAVFVSGGGELSLPAIRIKAPVNFETRLFWSGSDSAHRSFPAIAAPNLIQGNAFLQPLNWTGTSGNSAALNVLELYDFNEKNIVTPQQPLVVEFKKEFTKSEAILALAYDPETQRYYSVGRSFGGSSIRIIALPDVSPSQRSLGGSIKLYFYQVIFNKISFNYHYPQLALATVHPDSGVLYETDKNAIKEKIASGSVKRILLFTHGPYGNTSDMVKSFSNAPGNLPIEAVLTFDYEYSSTSIEETAQQLKKALAEVGLHEADNKNLTIVAHSTGGLVTRWFIEKLNGNKIADRVILLGTPNRGAPLTDENDLFEVLLTLAINNAAFLKPWIFEIIWMGRLANGLLLTHNQMNDKRDNYTFLSNNSDPHIPYTLIGGNVRELDVDLSKEVSLIRKIFHKSDKAEKYEYLKILIFNSPTDLVAGTDGMLSIPGSEKWAVPPEKNIVPCDHFNYLTNPKSLSVISHSFS